MRLPMVRRKNRYCFLKGGNISTKIKFHLNATIRVAEQWVDDGLTVRIMRRKFLHFLKTGLIAEEFGGRDLNIDDMSVKSGDDDGDDREPDAKK